jgi:hypothetical protein
MATYGTVSSVSQRGLFEPFELQVARGQIAFHSVVTVSGYNSDVDTAWEMITPVGDLSYPAAALQMTVSSSSVSDTAAGTGARTVLITGLDANYAVISETVTMNGQTAVTTTKSFLRINNMLVTTAGTGLANAGTIYIGSGALTSGVPAIVYNLIAVGYNNATSSQYTIPAGYTGYLIVARIGLAQDTGTSLITARTRFVGTNGIAITGPLIVTNNSISTQPFPYPLAIAEKTRIQGEAIGGAANNEAAGFFEIVLIKNSYDSGGT